MTDTLNPQPSTLNSQLSTLNQTTELVLDHTGSIGYSFLHNTLVEGKSHAQTQEVRGDADR
jgi:hypothetical protein